ncbi:MAG: helix-hairpin-helix domain-containing protein [Bacteroidia bacterium]|nr:helix-hairpin-helix domain-containing protein [Bacteroidia bacterium]
MRSSLYFELNQVDSLTLTEIRGIGPVLSRRIIRYRDQLGGFVSFQQLGEVYGLTEDVRENLKAHSFLSDSPVRKLKINEASLDELRQHPYIGYRKARVIVNYRLQHGRFTSIDALSKINLMDSLSLDKLAPYLSL